MHPMMHPFHSRPRTVREPPRQPRAAEPVVAPRPGVDLDAQTTVGGEPVYTIKLTAPSAHALDNARASLSDHGHAIDLSAVIIKSHDDEYQYVTRSRTGIYAEPSQHSLVAVLPAGHRVSGSSPSRSGWIRLDDDEWILDDGSVALVSRPSPARRSPFSKRVELPSDADLRRAQSEPLRDGGLLITVPRVRAKATPRQVPVQNAPKKPAAAPAPAKRAPPPAPKPAATPKPTAPPPSKAAPAAKQPPTGADADEMKRQHKRQAAERRDALGRVVSSDYEGPVLMEVAACEVGARNVQSPTEEVEEWVATADGGFAIGSEVVVEMIVDEPAGGSEEEEDELSYYGF